MSTDKLAETIRSNQKTGIFDEEAISPAAAARRVRAEFVVIDRDDLPEVDTSGHEWVAVVRRSPGAHADAIATRSAPNVDPGWHDARALAHLAMAEHLRTSPPVDEKAVDELHDALIERIGQNAASRTLARSLVADGWKREAGS